MAIALLVIGAQIAIPLPGMVPISLQTLAIYVIAMTFNENQALMMTLVYLFMGAIGLPVFANFTDGIDHLIGPSGGFLLAFPIMAYVISWLVHNYDHKLMNLVGIILGLKGVALLSLVGDALKMVCALTIVRSLKIVYCGERSIIKDKWVELKDYVRVSFIGLEVDGQVSMKCDEDIFSLPLNEIMIGKL